MILVCVASAAVLFAVAGLFVAAPVLVALLETPIGVFPELDVVEFELFGVPHPAVRASVAATANSCANRLFHLVKTACLL